MSSTMEATARAASPATVRMRRAATVRLGRDSDSYLCPPGCRPPDTYGSRPRAAGGVPAEAALLADSLLPPGTYPIRGSCRSNDTYWLACDSGSGTAWTAGRKPMVADPGEPPTTSWVT